MSVLSTTILLQDACRLHQYIRSKDVSTIVERPQRLRAVNIGVAALCARLETLLQRSNKDISQLKANTSEEDLVAALGKLDIQESVPYGSTSFPVRIHRSKATLDILSHHAVKYVHGDIERDTYLENLIKWAKESRRKIVEDGTEIPEGLSQGDLYCETQHGSFT